MGFNSCQAQQWSNEQVLQWLGTIGLTQLVPRFQQEEGEFQSDLSTVPCLLSVTAARCELAFLREGSRRRQHGAPQSLESGMGGAGRGSEPARRPLAGRRRCPGLSHRALRHSYHRCLACPWPPAVVGADLPSLTVQDLQDSFGCTAWQVGCNLRHYNWLGGARCVRRSLPRTWASGACRSVLQLILN